MRAFLGEYADEEEHEGQDAVADDGEDVSLRKVDAHGPQPRQLPVPPRKDGAMHQPQMAQSGEEVERVELERVVDQSRRDEGFDGEEEGADEGEKGAVRGEVEAVRGEDCAECDEEEAGGSLDGGGGVEENDVGKESEEGG